MRDSIRLRILRQSTTPIKKHPRQQSSPQSKSKSQVEQQAKPPNQNDLVKWIVISDAPDYAAAESQWRNNKNLPVMARHPTYLDRFRVRDLRVGLECLRAMNDCAQNENEKLERVAEVLGFVALVETEDSGSADEAPAASTAMEFDTPIPERSQKSQIVVLRFDRSFYRVKVLPFIQAWLIAENIRFNPQEQPPRTPTALPFPGNINHSFESSRQLHAAKEAYDTAANAGLPQEACDTAARRRLSLVRRMDAPAVKSLSISPEPPNTEPEFVVLESPPTPGGYYVDGDEAFAEAAKGWQMGSQQSQTGDGLVAAAAHDRSPTPSECPPTPRAPDLDMMDADVYENESESAGNTTGTAKGAKHDAGTVSTRTDTRVDTPMAKTATSTMATATTPLFFHPTSASTSTSTSTPAHADTTVRTPASLPLPSTSRKVWLPPLPPPFRTPQQPLRRSTRSTQSRTIQQVENASQQLQRVARMSVRQLQREILRLCAERETTLVRNEVLREWLGGVVAASSCRAFGDEVGVQEEVERMEVDG